MSNGLKLLLIAVAALIVLAVVGYGMGLFTIGQDITKNTQKDMQGLNQSISAKKYEVYNSTTVSGSEVINAVRMYGETDLLTVTVKTKLGVSSIPYSSTSKYAISDPTVANYINPTGLFTSTLTTNTNGIVTTLAFVQP